MFWLVVLAAALALSVGEPAAESVTSASGTYGMRDPGHQRRPNVGIPDMSRGHRIIEEVHLPDYREPTLHLDYRYLRTGGRDYTRGPGGQYLILPHNMRTNEHKKYRNYDELLEALTRIERARYELHNDDLRNRHRNWGYSVPRVYVDPRDITNWRSYH